MKVYYSEDELNLILSPEDGQKDIFIPNEIFTDLVNEIDVNEKGKSSKHIAFAFSYHYLCMYLYRYARFGCMFEFTEEELKKICTISPHSKGKNSITYITKRDGLLNKLGYLEKVSDFPVAQYFLEDEQIVEFVMWSEYKRDTPQVVIPSNRKVNEPLKLTRNRIVNIGGEDCETYGILTDISNTTKISVDVFIYCMGRVDLGCEGFYLYCFLKNMNYKFKKGWSCPLDSMPDKIGMKRDIIKARLKSLEEYNMITSNHVPFVPYLRDYTSATIPSNTYSTNEYEEFIHRGQPKKSIIKRRVMSPESYEKEYGFNSIEDDELIIDMSFLDKS